MIESLYQKYHKELSGWCNAMTGNSVLTDDLLQETWLKALLNQQILDILKPPQQRAWLYRTIKNLYIDHIRHAAFEIIPESIPESVEESPAYISIDCAQMLAFLPDEERMLFTMRYIQGFTSREIGTMLSLPPGTVRSKLSSARQHLRNIWKK